MAIILISVAAGSLVNSVFMWDHVPDIIESVDAFQGQSTSCIHCFQFMCHAMQAVQRFSKGYWMLIFFSFVLLFYHL